LISSAKIFIALGAVFAALAVGIGAFGAHALRARLGAEMLSVYQTGVHYHFWHALGILAVGIACLQLPASLSLRVAGWLLSLGIVLFSGSLYALALSGERWLGAVTPVGGLAFILGWLALALAVLKA
jgi:uncharacterized membrane protein YgdD (TMEM256/DUF423 family)